MLWQKIAAGDAAPPQLSEFTIRKAAAAAFKATI